MGNGRLLVISVLATGCDLRRPYVVIVVSPTNTRHSTADVSPAQCLSHRKGSFLYQPMGGGRLFDWTLEQHSAPQIGSICGCAPPRKAAMMHC